MRASTARRAAAVTCLSLALASCGRGDTGATAEGCDPGVTDTEVKIGGSLPMSGAGAAYGVLAGAADAAFKKANADGGVRMADGKQRQITYKYLDDAYDPARTVGNIKTLVESEGVFATFQLLGTSPNLAVADYLGAKEVPQLFVNTGTDLILERHEENPWIFAFLPQYGFEAQVVADHVKAQRPKGKVGILYQNDGFGKNMLANFKKQFEGSDVTIVSEQPYEQTGASVDSQVVNLQASGADVFVNYATGTFATQAIRKAHQLGWKPLHMLTNGTNHVESILKPAGADAATGITTMLLLKDPNDPEYASTPEVKEYRAVLAEHGPGLNPADAIVISGFLQGQMLVEALENSGCTRQELLDATYNLTDVEAGMLLPGITVNTKPDYPYLFTQAKLAVFDGTRYVPQDELMEVE